MTNILEQREYLVYSIKHKIICVLVAWWGKCEVGVNN
jgi:hypothetical protein